MEYKKPRGSYTEKQNFQADTQGQFQDYEKEESTPNKTNFPSMESFCNTEEPDKNITSIKKTTDQDNFYHQWSNIDNQHETIVEDTTPMKNTRMIFNTKFHKNLPTPRQDQQNRSLHSGNKEQVRFHDQQNRSFQTGYQDQHRFHNQLNRNSQPGNQDRTRFQVPPPNMERDMVIKEINKMGINQKSTTQQDLHDQETNSEAVEEMRQSFKEKEKANKEDIEAQYRAQIDNLIREKSRAKGGKYTKQCHFPIKVKLSRKHNKHPTAGKGLLQESTGQNDTGEPKTEN